jgi:hypothetical protein
LELLVHLIPNLCGETKHGHEPIAAYCHDLLLRHKLDDVDHNVIELYPSISIFWLLRSLLHPI